MKTADQMKEKYKTDEVHSYAKQRRHQVNVHLPAEMIVWLHNQPKGVSKTVRMLIKDAMEKA